MLFYFILVTLSLCCCMWFSLVLAREATLYLTCARSCCCSVAQLCPTFAARWNAACQASLFFTICWSLLKFMSIESVMPSNHLILCRPLLLLPSIFPSIREWVDSSSSGGQSIRASTSASILPMNIQDWFPLGSTCLISLQSKGISKSSPASQFNSISFWASTHYSGFSYWALECGSVVLVHGLCCPMAYGIFPDQE